MAEIQGVGGIFLRCENVEAYRAWWRDKMGVALTDWGTLEWEHPKSPVPSRTMLSPFADDTDYFKPSEQRVMINLRTDNVRAMIDRAKSAGAEIAGEIEDTEYGIFGWFIDPEGYKIELWQEP